VNDSNGDYMEDESIDARSLSTLEALAAMERGGPAEVIRMARLGRALMSDVTAEEADWNDSKEESR
jgi:hypothetical protein